MWLVGNPCTRQSLGTGKEREEQKSLKESWPCLSPTAQKAAVWLLLTNICAGPGLSKGAQVHKFCLPRWGFQLGGCRWNLALYHDTNIASLLLSVYKEGEGATSFLWSWDLRNCSKVKSFSSAGNGGVTAAWLALLLPRQNFFLISPVLSERGGRSGGSWSLWWL